MASTSATSFAPRKTPVQKRSGATVAAIFEATLQVLVKLGPARLTTTAVAARAGVSVGTLYQYFPNKQVLLHAVLEHHLNEVLTVMLQVCEQQRGAPAAVMVRVLVNRFLDGKMDRPEAASALYAVSIYPTSAALQVRLRKRAVAAMAELLASAADARFADVDQVAAMLYSTLAGSSRSALEAGATRLTIDRLRGHLGLMCEAYVLAAAQPAAQPS